MNLVSVTGKNWLFKDFNTIDIKKYSYQLLYEFE